MVPNINIILLYSSINSTEIALFKCSKRKIIIAIDIEEFPINGVEIIIDTMTENSKQPLKFNKQNSYNYITKLCADRHLNILGNLYPGICYRLMTENMFKLLDNNKYLQDIQHSNQILTTNHNIISDFLKAGIDPIEAIININKSELLEHIKLLINLDMICKIDKKYAILPCNIFSRTIPLNARNSAFVWKWMQMGYPIYPGIVIASLIDAYDGGYFYIPRKQNLKLSIDYDNFCTDYINKTFKEWIDKTPMHSYLNMWKSFTNYLKHLHYNLINRSKDINYYRWSNMNHVNHSQLVDLVKIISETYEIIRNNLRNINADVYIFNVNKMVKYATPILCDIYKDITLDIVQGNMIHPKTKIPHIFDIKYIADEKFDNCGIIPLVTRYTDQVGYIDMFIPVFDNNISKLADILINDVKEISINEPIIKSSNDNFLSKTRKRKYKKVIQVFG